MTDLDRRVPPVRRAGDEIPQVAGWRPITFNPGTSPTADSAQGDQRLLVTGYIGAVAHTTVDDLPTLLQPGDVVVINTSSSDAGKQTVFAATWGGGAVPWSGRALSADLVLRMIVKGIHVVPLVLHAACPSLGSGVQSEFYDIPTPTARLVNAARAANHRVVAIGTTVLRALESAAAEDGVVSPGCGSTSLVLAPPMAFRAVDALFTGLHPPATTHLAIIEAFVGFELLASTYTAAIDSRYRWGEWGDRNLLFRQAAA